MPGKTIRRLVLLLAACGVAHGQQPPREGTEGMIVAWTVAMVQSCIQVDELLRKTCARAGVLPNPEKNRALCELGPATFEVRTAQAYAEFKERWRAVLKANEAEVAKASNELRRVIDKDFGHLRSGTFTMLELDSLSRQSKECTNNAMRMLAPPRIRK